MGDLLPGRRGETEWSVSGRHTSRTGLPPTPHGAEQAKSRAPLLSGRTFALRPTSPARPDRPPAGPRARGRLFQPATGTLGRLSTEHGRPVIAEWNGRG
ncbi:histidine phosphatase family protein [Streptomyces sp. NPDC058964]|uniref:histidine phosphatase family protein n=1 Tax=Streptomyces sp. NPDC058964 TaxID=3346681 RepID=UPI0036CC412B